MVSLSVILPAKRKEVCLREASRSNGSSADAYARLEEEIGEFEALGLGALGDFQPEEIRRMAEEYFGLRGGRCRLRGPQTYGWRCSFQ